MSLAVRQSSFAGGEVGPEFYGRVDSDRYHEALRTCRNWLVTRNGAVQNRPGTTFVAQAMNVGVRGRLLPFIFSDGQALVLEVGDLSIRAYQTGTLVATIPTTYTIADVPRLKFAQVGNTITITHANYPPRDLMRAADGSWSLNDVNFQPALSGVTLSIAEDPVTGTVTNWSSTKHYVLGDWVVGTDGNGQTRLYVCNVPTSTNNDPGQGATQWSVDVDAAHPGFGWSWLVSRLTKDAYGVVHETFSSVPVKIAVGVSGPNNISARYSDHPKHLSWTAPADYSTLGYNVYAGHDGVWGLISTLPGGAAAYTDTGAAPDYTQQPRIGTNPFLLGSISQWAPQIAYAWSGVSQPWVFFNGVPYVATASNQGVAPPGASAWQAAIPWSSTTGYVPGWYVSYNGNYYTATQASLGQAPSSTSAYWTPAISYPSVVAFHEGRRVFARSNAKPQTIWGSSLADASNFDISIPVTAAQSYNWTISATRLEEIRSILPLRSLLLLTGSGEWDARSDNNGASISPLAIDLKRQSNWGISWVDPITTDNGCLFIQSLGSTVRDLFFFYYGSSYTGQDLSAVASHFFDGHSVTAWAYQKVPNRITWMVRDDGVLLGLTYQRNQGSGLSGDQTAYAWHQHTFNGGIVEDVCCVPETTEDVVYLLIRRTINGVTQRYIERMATRVVTDARKGVFLDCSTVINGRNATAGTLALTSSTAMVSGGGLSGAFFNVGDRAVFHPDAAAPVTATITLSDGAGNYTVQLENGDWTTATVTTDWGQALATVSGLAYLEGQSVTALIDGSVQGPFTVTSGFIAPAVPGVDVIVGLPILNADVEPLDLASRTAEVRNHHKRVTKIGFQVDSSRGLWVGEDTASLVELDPRDVADSYGPPALNTDYYEAEINSDWNKNNRCVLRQVDPLPVTLVSILREFELGGT